MRTFIAIELPEDVKAKVFHTFEKLKQSGLVRGTFLEKNNLHLTLKYLGDLTEDKVKEIEKELSTIKINSFDAKTGEIGFFPSDRHINVIWVELISEKIVDVQKLIDEKLVKLGFQMEKGFKPHITIARIKSVKNKDVFINKLNEIHLKPMNFNVKNFSLMKSELKREGPTYKELVKFTLI